MERQDAAVARGNREFRGRRVTEADSKHRFPVLESRPTEPGGPGVNGGMGDAVCVSLKAVWANISRVRVPALDELVDSLGLTAADLPVTGRAGRRLSLAHTMARHILNGVVDAA
jgi:hypothetical protein